LHFIVQNFSQRVSFSPLFVYIYIWKGLVRAAVPNSGTARTTPQRPFRKIVRP
jgi:hypothetical protein